MSETAEQRQLRLAVAEMADGSIARVAEMLRLHLLLPEERAVPGGIGIGPSYLETPADHVRILERVLTLLRELRRRLGAGPVPDDWHGDAQGTIVVTGPDPITRGLYLFFYHYAHDISQDVSIAVGQHISLVHPTWSDRAHLTGIHVWVPDASRPESVLRLDPTLAPRGPVVDLWRDERKRLFYLVHGHRQYIFDAEGQFPAH